MLQSDLSKLLRAFITNFIDPDVIKDADDVTGIDYTDPTNQLSDDELGIGTSARMLLCGELEDEVVGTRIETRLFTTVRPFYEIAVTKILAKFPFNESTLKELAFLDNQNRGQTSSAGLITLSNRFASFNDEDRDRLEMEFCDFRASTDAELPAFDPQDSYAIDHF